MTAEDTEHRDDESTETEGSDHQSSDAEGSDRSADDHAADERSDEDPSEERVKQRGRYDDDTPGITDARPGREDIGESQMPSDYHQAVAERPVEVKLPDVPDLSEDAESGTRDSETGTRDSDSEPEDDTRAGGGAHAAGTD